MTKPKALSHILLSALGFVLFGSSVFALTKSHFADFLVFEDNPVAIIRLSETNPEAFANLPEASLDKVFDFLFLKNQRNETRKWVLNIYRDSMCSVTVNRAKLCAYLVRLWKGALLETFFWDASLVQLSRARELLAMSASTPKIRREQCQESRNLLSDLEAKEGACGPVLETQVQVFECLGDESARLDVYQRLETLRNIQSAF